MSLPNLFSSPNSVPAVQSVDLGFTYEKATSPALKGISLKIQPGEFVIIAGPSGSGKSTLARCLAGFIPHEYPGLFEGTVHVLGHDTETQTIRNLARNISLIQQDPDSQLVTLNVLNEVAFGPENFQVSQKEIEMRIEWALNAVLAKPLQKRQTHTLSGGEKQKIIIASFLALQSPILIFDEPTARLDPRTTSDVIKTLRQLHNQGATIIVIEHRIQPFLPFASRLVLINKGTVFYNGAPGQMPDSLKTLTHFGLGIPAASKKTRLPEKSDSLLLGVQNLTYTYPQVDKSTPPPPALQEVSFALQSGEMVALMGANGSGKSTLLLHLIGLLQPDTGLIHLSGENIRNYPVSKLAQKIGFIFQNPLHQLFSPTVMEEILLAARHLGTPKPEQAYQRAEELLKTFRLEQYQNQPPFALSLGEQRRLTIASILLHNPQILLLDEPFIGQDYQSIHQLMQVLQKAQQQGTTIILATHDSAIAETYCDRLLFLSSGRLLIDAPVAQGLGFLNRLNMPEFPTKHNILKVC
ncbi:MAG: ABC transporter ATP-binding protein [Candidatus Thorarchaeota archaeon]